MKKILLLIVVLLCAAVIGKAMLALPSAQVAAPEPPRLDIGTILSADIIHPIQRPGLYGLGEPPRGSRYAVAGGNVVRLDVATGELLGVLRPMAKKLDEASFD